MTSSAPSAGTSTYFLGHSPHERERLMLQARFYERETEYFLREAGIREGMQVVDIGCGVGDVSFAVARLVGPTGSVLGVDLASPSLEHAEARAREMGLDQVAFTAGDVQTFIPGSRVDAVVGRLIVIYLPNPPVVMRQMRNWLRPGGCMAFLETDLPPVADAAPPIGLYADCIRWIHDAAERSGLETMAGLKLPAQLQEAGLAHVRAWGVRRVEGGSSSDAYEYIAATVRSLLPVIEGLEVASADDVQVDTLAERLRAEVVGGRGVIALPSLTAAVAYLEN